MAVCSRLWLTVSFAPPQKARTDQRDVLTEGEVQVVHLRQSVHVVSPNKIARAYMADVGCMSPRPVTMKF